MDYDIDCPDWAIEENRVDEVEIGFHYRFFFPYLSGFWTGKHSEIFNGRWPEPCNANGEIFVVTSEVNQRDVKGYFLCFPDHITEIGVRFIRKDPNANNNTISLYEINKGL